AYCSYCDRGHLIALERGAYPKKWPKLIDALFCKEPLTADTHACYAEIILLCHAGRHVEAVEEIGRAYKLYDRRQNDRVFRDTWSIEGGGEMNPHTVDYTLAAIVEHLFAGKKKLLKDVPPGHLWPWRLSATLRGDRQASRRA